MKNLRKGIAYLLMVGIFIYGMAVLAACSMSGEGEEKLEDIGFTVVSPEKVPGELMTLIEERQAQPFQLTYSDKNYLYIVIGYGQQEMGGYSIVVNEMYLTKDAICVDTELFGPEEGKRADKTPSFPYIVLKTDYMDKPVTFR